MWGVGLLAMTAGSSIGRTAGTREERAADSATREVATKMRRQSRRLRTGSIQYANERTRTSVSLPADAAGPLLLSRHQGSISVQLRGASAASLGGLVDGMVIYPDSIGRGVHSIHRPLPSGGDEELVYFERHPERSSVEYELVAPTGVVGAVNRDGALDLLDRAGRSVLPHAVLVSLGGGGCSASRGVYGGKDMGVGAIRGLSVRTREGGLAAALACCACASPTQRFPRTDCAAAGLLIDEYENASYEPGPMDQGPLMHVARDLTLIGRLGQPDTLIPISHGLDFEPTAKGQYFTGFRCAFPPRALP